MEDLKPIIAKNIIDLRKSTDMTQAQLAEKLNYSDKAVSKWERGDAIPCVTTLKEIADLFGVTVDYLITAEHDAERQTKKEYSARKKRNHVLITLLSVMAVWFAATVVFVSTNLSTAFETWLSFVYAVPLSCVVLIVFNSIWWKNKLNYLYASILTWSLLLAVYIMFLVLHKNFWLLLILGIPLQIMILLFSGIRFRRKK